MSFYDMMKLIEDKRLPQPSKYCTYKKTGLLAKKKGECD